MQMTFPARAPQLISTNQKFETWIDGFKKLPMEIQHAVFLNEPMRVQDGDQQIFRTALSELSNGKCSDASYDMWQSRFQENLSEEERTRIESEPGTLRLFPRNDDKRQYNLDALDELKVADSQRASPSAALAHSWAESLSRSLGSGTASSLRRLMEPSEALEVVSQL